MATALATTERKRFAQAEEFFRLQATLQRKKNLVVRFSFVMHVGMALVLVIKVVIFW